MADDPTRYLDVSGVLALKAGSTVDVGYTVTHARSVAARLGEVGAQANSALVRATSAGETASTALSSAGRAVAETHETRSLLDQYRDSTGYTVNDDYTVTLGEAGEAGEPTGAAAEALEDAYRRSVSVAEYGAVGDDATDDTAAIQAAADAAHAAGATLFFPPGKYRTSGTVTLRGRVQGDKGTIRYHGGGTALVVGSPDAGAPAWRTMYRLPKVEHRTTAWDGTSVGVRIVNANACEIHIPYVREFETGLIFEGRGTGFAYNTIVLGTLWCNHRQWYWTANNSGGGYCNQNTIIGGRLQMPASYGYQSGDPRAFQLQMLSDDSTWGPNSNTFIGTSFETDAAPAYALDIGGPNNHFVNCRWEGFGRPFRVRWRSGSMRNVIDGGYDVWKIQEQHDGNGVNIVRDPEGAYAVMQTTAGQTIPHDTRTVVRYWDSQMIRSVTNVAAEGKLRPKRGRWRVTARLTYAASAAGRRQAFLCYQGDTSPGASTFAAAEASAGSQPGARPTITVSGTRWFDGATDVWVETWQTSGAGLILATSVGACVLDLEHLGP